MGPDINRIWDDTLSTTVLRSGVAHHLAELSAVSSRSAALLCAGTLNDLGTARFRALGATADLIRFGAVGARALSSGVAQHLAGLDAVFGQRAALSSAEGAKLLGADRFAALGAAADRISFSGVGATALGSGVAHQLAGVDAVSTKVSAAR